jgi:hypothetical protein
VVPVMIFGVILCYFRVRLDSRFLDGFGSDLFGGFFFECLVPLFPMISCPQTPQIVLDS